MKTTRSMVLMLAITLFGFYGVYGQSNGAADDAQTTISILKGKANEANTYAQKIHTAASFDEAKAYAKQAFSLLSEMENIIKNAQTSVSKITIPEDNNPYKKIIRNISDEIIGIEHATNYTLLQSGKINTLKEFEEVKFIGLDMMEELKKIDKATTEIESMFMQAKQILITNN